MAVPTSKSSIKKKKLRCVNHFKNKKYNFSTNKRLISYYTIIEHSNNLFRRRLFKKL